MRPQSSWIWRAFVPSSLLGALVSCSDPHPPSGSESDQKNQLAGFAPDLFFRNSLS